MGGEGGLGFALCCMVLMVNLPWCTLVDVELCVSLTSDLPCCSPVGRDLCM